MRPNSADQVFNSSARARAVRINEVASSRRHNARQRRPSAAGYMAAAALIAASLFFLISWILHNSGEEAPWLPAGLAATVVMLVAVAAREVVMRRAWTRYLLEQERADHSSKKSGEHHHRSGSIDKYVAALRALQKVCTEADTVGSSADAHLKAQRLCTEYLTETDAALRHRAISTEGRVVLRAGQERVRFLQKHHMLSWVRTSSQAITQEAQKRVLFYDKIETAQRALDVIDEALKLYPNENELYASALAVHEFIASVRVGRWVEMAERAAFKGHLMRAIDRYRDALFYLSREEKMSEEMRVDAAERIWREIEMLRARMKTSQIMKEPAKKK